MKILIPTFAALAVGVYFALSRAPTIDAPGAAAENAWFADVTDASGVRFVHDAGPTDG